MGSSQHVIFETNIYGGVQNHTKRAEIEIVDNKKYKVMLVTSGLIELHSEGQCHKAKRGMGLLLPYSADYRLVIPNKFVCIFAKTFHKSRKPSGKAMSFIIDGRLNQILALVQEELKAPRPDSTDMLKVLYRRILYLGLDHLDKSKSPKETHAKFWVQTIKSILHANLYSNLNLDDLLGSLSLSRRQLQHHFHAGEGQSIKGYFSQLKINEAKKLLRTSDFSLTAIALELGFSSAQHFSTQFKKHTGINPKAFREGAKP